ncbi:hypothetical protein LIER_13554 [Lithospermum erythrorhizon]|uniref:Uncharacterized protein n=1 Tax=Lithospermum erythrorhizon TaxID=34254 RepID=A0AAV3PVV1_LITER
MNLLEKLQNLMSLLERYGKEFQERKLARYMESGSDDEVGDSILSDKEADCDLKSIASSSDEEAVDHQARKDKRFVQFNEKNMRNPLFFQV